MKFLKRMQEKYNTILESKYEYVWIFDDENDTLELVTNEVALDIAGGEQDYKNLVIFHGMDVSSNYSPHMKAALEKLKIDPSKVNPKVRGRNFPG